MQAWGTACSCPRLRPPPALPLPGTLLPAVGKWEQAQPARQGKAKGSPQPLQHDPQPHGGQAQPGGVLLLRATPARTAGEPG